MSDMIQEVIEHELNHDFYFLQVPNGVPEYIWKDRDGAHIFMDSMGLDHLKACINIVQNAISRLERSLRRSEVKQALLPHADKKLKELQECFSKKVGGSNII